MTWLGLIINNAYHTKKMPINTTNTPRLVMNDSYKKVHMVNLT
ncbi:hypothetical protein EJK55_0333 [Moraxella catarrhalis]|uniref:Uncharacterized protein n=1 Tax=Moraxella catarrhalis TaxID=480 RepID=A0A3Q9GC45_MORCA|nr:hypothetical protein MCR_0630 [Moraxella catarrhalis BBH18]AZQ86602.1 hypothetical protein EJK52_0663 [Moraxella catarrhalis]EKF84159.1 hypothetical protein MCRH_0687 [Moraxella catarrhalis RH4]AZQ88904.1 hypothetical protein EJK50_0658 [Moraxella catarrhalis]AZQ92056.1 hypothetical protein EJK51_0661 [Moraxella catarrhalis]